MTVAADTPRRNIPGKFRTVDIGEPIVAKVSVCQSPADLRTCLKELRALRTPGLTLLVRLPRTFGGQELPGLLDAATGTAGRVVLVPPHGGGATLEELRRAGRRGWPCPVQVEPEPARAVVGAMLSLRAGDTLAVLWPDDAGLPSASSLVALGARWRSSLEAPEDGEFHWLPPERDAL